MAQYSREQVIETMKETGMVPVFYNPDIETSKKVLKACYDGGVRVFEFTNRGDKAREVFKELIQYSATLPGLILGVGSISFAKDAREFIKLGANFVVGPQTVQEVFQVCNWRHIPYVPGCGTVTEVGYASHRFRCEICKVFPGEVLGPAFVKSLKAPMPWVNLMVTGGVAPTEESLREWFKAGVCCVGMGSKLFPKESLESGDWASITSLCKNCLDIIKTLK